jgi:hypothetical protein
MYFNQEEGRAMTTSKSFQKRVLVIQKDRGNKTLTIRTHADYEDYRLSFRTDVWSDREEDFVFDSYTTRKYVSEMSMLQAFAAIVNECLFDGSKFSISVR